MTFLRLLGRTLTEPSDFIRTFLAANTPGGDGALQGGALFKALPEVPKAEIVWRFHFMLGAMSYAIAGTDALRLVTDWQIEDNDGPETALTATGAASDVLPARGPACAAAAASGCHGRWQTSQTTSKIGLSPKLETTACSKVIIPLLTVVALAVAVLDWCPADPPCTDQPAYFWNLPQGAAADVRHRARSARSRHGLVGWRIVPGQAGLEQAAGLPGAQADCRKSSPSWTTRLKKPAVWSMTGR
jgi:hypothetical protein